MLITFEVVGALIGPTLAQVFVCQYALQGNLYIQVDDGRPFVAATVAPDSPDMERREDLSTSFGFILPSIETIASLGLPDAVAYRVDYAANGLQLHNLALGAFEWCETILPPSASGRLSVSAGTCGDICYNPDAASIFLGAFQDWVNGGSDLCLDDVLG